VTPCKLDLGQYRCRTVRLRLIVICRESGRVHHQTGKCAPLLATHLQPRHTSDHDIDPGPNHLMNVRSFNLLFSRPEVPLVSMNNFLRHGRFHCVNYIKGDRPACSIYSRRYCIILALCSIEVITSSSNVSSSISQSATSSRPILAHRPTLKIPCFKWCVIERTQPTKTGLRIFSTWSRSCCEARVSLRSKLARNVMQKSLRQCYDGQAQIINEKCFISNYN